MPQFTVKHRGPAVFSGGREVVDWARNGQVGCPCLGCGWFSQSSPTEVVMQAAPSSLASALVRDSKPTSLASAELALGCQHLPCDGCDGRRNRAGE